MSFFGRTIEGLFGWIRQSSLQPNLNKFSNTSTLTKSFVIAKVADETRNTIPCVRLTAHASHGGAKGWGWKVGPQRVL